jgi:hypothetical protein
MTKENTMTIWVLERWDWDSCGECKSVHDTWYFTTKEKAEKVKADCVAAELKGWLLNGPTEKEIAGNYHINQVEVL